MTMLDLLDKLRPLFRIMLSVILPCCDIMSINSCRFRYKWHLKRKWSAFSVSPHLQLQRGDSMMFVIERAATSSKSSMKYLHASVACIKVFWNNCSALI